MLYVLLFSALWAMCCGLPHQYHFVNESKSWFKAQSFCRNNYTDLATVDNTEDMNRLLESANGSYNSLAWIGLYDDPQKSWRWSLDDPQFYKKGKSDFRNWITTLSSDFGRGDSCVMIYKGYWQIYSCENLVSFVCFDGRENAAESLVLVQEHKNWTKAQSYCREHYTDLASVRNLEENSMISNLVGADYSWIGLYRPRIWSDGSNSSFRYWKTEEQSVNSGPQTASCTAVSFGDSGRWIEQSCNLTLPFICYTGLPKSLRIYHFVPESKNCSEAQSFCRNTYTDLATVDNMEDMNRLLESANGSYDGLAWLGLYDDLQDGWRWSLDDAKYYKDGEKDFRNWFQYPLNEGGNDFCTLMLYETLPMYIGKWVDESCSDKHTFICYDGSDGSGTYIPIAEPKNWHDAQKYCRAHHTDLVSVRSVEENMEIFMKAQESITSNSWGFWIGLYRNGTWSDNSSFTSTLWGAREADNGGGNATKVPNQHCIAVWLNLSGQWSHENCLTRRPFFCYSSISTSEPTTSPRLGHVISLNAKIRTQDDISASDIENLILIKLQEELHMLARVLKVSVKSIHKTLWTQTEEATSNSSSEDEEHTDKNPVDVYH